MIRPYVSGDEYRIKANKFSDLSGYRQSFESDYYVKHTHEIDGAVLAIVCWFEYEPKKYGSFLIISTDFRSRHARELRAFIGQKLEEIDADYFVTYSQESEVIYRWHQFIGFTDPERCFLDGRQYNKWFLRKGAA